MKGARFCFWHDPENRNRMLAASSKGGSRKCIELPSSEALSASRAREVIAGLLAELLSGNVEVGTGRAVGYLLQVDTRIRETCELERRVTALEASSGLDGR